MRGIVDRIIIEHRSFVVDVPYQHSVSGKVLVPTFLLAIFKQEEFVGINSAGCAVSVNDTSLIGVFDVIECHRLGVFELFEIDPSHGIALVYRICRRSATVVIVRTVVKDAPSVRGNVACDRVIVGAIQVRETEDVAEFVDESTYAVRASLLPFVGGGVSVDLSAVGTVCDTEVIDMCRVRPYGFFRAVRSLALAGVEHVYIVYISVVVGIVLAQVHLIFEGCEGMCHHQMRLHIIAVIIVAAVIAAVLTECHRAVHIEDGTELAVGAFAEVFGCRSRRIG